MRPVSNTLLLADDSATTRRVVEMTFADQDLRVVSVGDGQQAIERAQQDPPDVVLADIGMPGRDGYEVAEFVRSHPGLRHVPVLLMAGAFEPADDARVAACGAVGVLIKPLEPDTVISRVKELLRRGSAPTPVHRFVTPAPEAAPEPVPAVQTPEALPGGLEAFVPGREPALAPRFDTAPAEAAPMPVAPAPAAVPVPVNDAFADAFAALLDAEQGGGPIAAPEDTPLEVPEPAEPAVPGAEETPDAASAMALALTPAPDADALATEVTALVTERLIGGIGQDVVRAVATEVASRVAREVAEQVSRELVAAVAERVTREIADGVAERVVREEIARIRAAAAESR